MCYTSLTARYSGRSTGNEPSKHPANELPLTTEPNYRYRLIRPIGRGATSEVWEAMQERPDGSGRLIAMKRLLPQYTRDVWARKMFLREAQLASRLIHPNIVAVLDTGMAGEREFIATEFVDGIDAATAITSGKRIGSFLPSHLALKIVADVAAALQFAHASPDPQGGPPGIVHRDVNPPNIMLSRTGTVKLTDFGIARAKEQRDQASSGMVQGKESFIAPELLTGHVAGASADIYSLGATLHVLLSGSPPMQGWRQISHRMRGGPLPLAPSIEPPIRQLIEQCMQVDATQRPSAAQVNQHAAALTHARAPHEPADELKSWVTNLLAQTRHGHFDDLFTLPTDDRSD